MEKIATVIGAHCPRKDEQGVVVYEDEFVVSIKFRGGRLERYGKTAVRVG